MAEGCRRGTPGESFSLTDEKKRAHLIAFAAPDSRQKAGNYRRLIEKIAFLRVIHQERKTRYALLIKNVPIICLDQCTGKSGDQSRPAEPEKGAGITLTIFLQCYKARSE